jgi:hypothetical protein
MEVEVDAEQSFKLPITRQMRESEETGQFWAPILAAAVTQL